MIKSKHKLSYCKQCEHKIVICYNCGNNCCNGGHGIVNGEECKECAEAYQHQTIYMSGGKIKFKKKIK